MVTDNPLIAYVQFEHDGRARATGAFRLPDWPVRWSKTPAMGIEAARHWLVERGGHYPVMAASTAGGSFS